MTEEEIAEFGGEGYVSSVFYIDGARAVVVRGVPRGAAVEFGWATRTTNKRVRDGRAYHSRRCAGVYECGRCGFRARPLVDERVRKEERAARHEVRGLELRVTCGGRCLAEDGREVAMELRACGVTIVARERADGTWEVRCSGVHGHGRPPALRLTPRERERLDAYVAGRRAGRGCTVAGARRQLAGPEHAQSPLHDRIKAQFQIRKRRDAMAGRRRDDVAAVDRVASAYGDYVVESRMAPFLLVFSLAQHLPRSGGGTAPSGESAASSASSVVGIVDTTHHISASDEIYLTSVLVPSMGHHVPVLLAYHRVRDAAMFARIFARLFEEVPRVGGLVMDFSDAQLCGLAMARAQRTRVEDVTDADYGEAARLVRGCAVHLEAAFRRAFHNVFPGATCGADVHAAFRAMVEAETRGEFDEARQGLSRMLEGQHGEALQRWWAWWFEQRGGVHARIAFPALFDEAAKRAWPATTNAIESFHSALKRYGERRGRLADAIEMVMELCEQRWSDDIARRGGACASEKARQLRALRSQMSGRAAARKRRRDGGGDGAARQRAPISLADLSLAKRAAAGSAADVIDDGFAFASHDSVSSAYSAALLAVVGALARWLAIPALAAHAAAAASGRAGRWAQAGCADVAARRAAMAYAGVVAKVRAELARAGGDGDGKRTQRINKQRDVFRADEWMAGPPGDGGADHEPQAMVARFVAAFRAVLGRNRDDEEAFVGQFHLVDAADVDAAARPLRARLACGRVAEWVAALGTRGAARQHHVACARLAAGVFVADELVADGRARRVDVDVDGDDGRVGDVVAAMQQRSRRRGLDDDVADVAVRAHLFVVVE